MSLKAMTWALYSVRSIPPLAKLVLVRLADGANEDGVCWPSMSKIAINCCLPRETVCRHIKILSDLGLIEKDRLTHGGSVCRFRLNMSTCCDGGSHGVVTEDHNDVTDDHIQVVTERHIEPLSIESKKEPKKDSCASPSQERREHDREFEEFWRHVPKKRDKGHAHKAFLAARKSATFEQIIDAMKRHRREMAGREEQFIPLPATWLNGKRWLDEPGLNLVDDIPFDEASKRAALQKIYEDLGITD